METEVYEVLSHYSAGDVKKIDRLTSGLVNATYYIETNSGEYILQRLGAVFSETTIHDMEAITRHILKKGMQAQEIVRTKDNAPFFKDTDGRIWRLLVFIEGETYDSLPDDALTREAGRVLAEFHVALEDFNPDQLTSKPVVHQTKQFYETFCEVSEKLIQDEPEDSQKGYYEYIQKTMPSLMLPEDLPKSVIHGDPKISNILFQNNIGICMIDLDTCMKHTLLVELGDALRWSAVSEEAFPNVVSLSRFSYAIQGYAKVRPLSKELKEYIPQAFAMVTLGLASRFAKDVYYDTYFGWDEKKYPSRKEHNKVRAKSLVSLTEDILRKEKEMREILGGN